MHQTLSTLPSRVVLDTNVLLNATFVADSSARYSIEQLNVLGFSPIIDEAIEDEAFLILRRLRIKLGLVYDPLEIFRSYLATSRILCLPRSHQFHIDKHVNRADQHVIGAASHYNAWVLTGDIKLTAQCQQLQIATRLPWDVIMEAATQEKRDLPLHYVLRVVGISSTNGSFFARIIPGSWAGMKCVGHFTVCDVENIGRIYYDSFTEDWVFSTALGDEVRLRCPLAPNEHWIISATYEIGGRGCAGSVTLRAAQPMGTSIQNNITVKGKFSAPTPGTITFGHSISQNDHWNGHIRRIILSPVAIDSKGWRALVKVPEAAPDPAASNVLEAALQRVQIAPDKIIVPSELWLRNLWI